uniref:Uncharacterized protein n=1 Tax=Megaselia scalaris TaxID=36166 RepID=T1GCX1_MEGSC
MNIFSITFLFASFFALSFGHISINVKQYQKCIYKGMDAKDIAALLGAGRTACKLRDLQIEPAQQPI